MTETIVLDTPKATGGYLRTLSKVVVVLMVLLMLAFSVAIRPVKELSGNATDRFGRTVFWGNDNEQLWGGTFWWDMIYATCLWAPLGFIALAVVALDRRGDNLTLEALEEDMKDTNKGETVLRNIQQRIWKSRWVVGRGWYRTVWSYGDLITTFLLVAVNLIWGLAQFLKFWHEYRDILSFNYDTPREQKIWMTYRWAYYLGYGGMFDAGITILFTLRENHLTRTCMGPEGGEYFHGIKYHIGLGYLTFAIFTIHSFIILPIELWNSDYDVYDTLNPVSGRNGHINFWGLIAWIALALMVVGSLWAVRRWNYRVFYWTHQLYIVFLFAACVHWPTSIYPITGILLYFAYDRLAPYLNFQRSVQGKITLVADEIVRVDVPLTRMVNQEYAPGDWINLRIPSVNLINWHPFSIGSFYRTSPTHATVFIKGRGAWTNKLLGKVNPELGTTSTVKLHVEGPVGVRQKTYLNMDQMVILGAGTGITAILPYAFQYSLTHPERKVTVVWIARCVEDMACYPELYRTCTHLARTNRFELQLYLTRESSSSIDNANVAVEVPMGITSENSAVSGDESSGGENRQHSPPEQEAGDWSTSEGSDTLPTGKPLSEERRRSSVLYGYICAIALVTGVFGVGLFSFFWPRTFQTEWDRGNCSWGFTNSAGEEVTITSGQYFECFYWQVTTMAISVLMGCVAGAVVILLYPFVAGRVSGWKNFNPPAVVTRSQMTTPWVVGRPNVAKTLESFCGEDDDSHHIGVMAAGPERLVIEVENLALKQKKMEFFRESWKV